MFLTLITRELRLLCRKKSELLQLMVFLALALLILPFAVENPQKIATGYVWIIQLFLVFLSLKMFFDDDWRDGSLEQLFLTLPSPAYIVIAKYIAYCLAILMISLPMLPLLALLFRSDMATLIKTAISLSTGIPCLAMIGGFGAALTLGSKKAGIIIPVILIPLYIPVLIFAVSGTFAMQAALLLLIAPLSIYFSGLALKIAIKE